MINEKHFVDSNPNYFKEKRERELAEKLSKKSLGKKSEEEYRRLRMNMIKQADESDLKIAVMQCLKSLKKLLMKK